VGYRKGGGKGGSRVFVRRGVVIMKRVLCGHVEDVEVEKT